MQGDKEIAVSQVDVHGDGGLFESALSEGYLRRRLIVYNNMSTDSGEVMYGGSAADAEAGMILEKGKATEIRLSSVVDLYFANSQSGETGFITIAEFA